MINITYQTMIKILRTKNVPIPSRQTPNQASRTPSSKHCLVPTVSLDLSSWEYKASTAFDPTIHIVDTAYTYN